MLGGAIAALAKVWPRVQAFGEFVAVLCEVGNREAAYQVEGLWHRLLSQYPLALLCAYPIKYFAEQNGGMSVSQICHCHTRVIPAESFSQLESVDDRLLAVTTLQQKALALELEIAARQRTERELADFVENAMEGLHKIGPDGKIMWANNAELKLLGYSAEEYLGRNIAESHVDPKVIEDILFKLNTGQEIYNYPARLRHKQGTEINVLIHSNGYYEDGRLIYARGFSRDVTESLDAERERALLAALVGSSDDVRSLMNFRASDEGIPLVFVWKSSIPQTITANRVRLRQILVNLISNAIKFTDDGEVRVSVSLDQERAQLLFEVSDTGIGMTPEELKRIFHPFTQASPETAQRFGGTGLGLTISKRLAGVMGGAIHVSSQAGQGSCFTLSLPVSEAQCKQLIEPRANRPTRHPTGHEPRLEIAARILLADDRRDVWRVGKYFLESCGAKVTVVEDGRQAVDTALQAEADGEPFSLVLMDMQMPVMNGREAVRELRAQGFDQPIVALTANAMEGDRQACLEIGCTEYLAKPIDGKKLIALVAKLLAK